MSELLLNVRDGAESEELRSVLQTADGRFWVDELLVKSWRLRVLRAQPLRRAGIAWYALDALGVRYRYDACAQSLRLDLAAVDRVPREYSLARARRPQTPAAADPGAYLNLDGQYTLLDGHSLAGVLGQAVLFGGAGNFQQSFVADDRRLLRLDTRWTLEWPERLYRLTLGDAIGSAGSWGNAVRYAGLRFATDFALQPYFVPFPQPRVQGGAALPSTLDVFINDNLSARQRVSEGPFELHDLPTLTGGGEAVLVMRDELGRQTRVLLPFYVSPQLLRPGLSDFALDAGVQRRQYGYASADYAEPFASFTQRAGVTEHFTRELRVEAQAHGAALGGSAFWLIDTLGLLTLTAAYSQGGEGHGALGGVGFERNLFGRYAVSLRTQWAEPRFRQLGQPRDLPALRHQDFASFSFAPHAGATAAFAYARQQRRGDPDTELYSLGYNLRLGRRWLLGVSANEVHAGVRERSVLASLSFQFDDGFSAGAQREWRAGHASAWRASLQHNAPGPLGLGWRADVQTGEFRRTDLRADWGTSYALLSGEAVDDAGGSGARLGASTALVWLGGNFFVSRPVQASFAVVRTGGLANVGVYEDHRLVARTDARGVALVPELRPYEENALSLRAEEVPVEWPLDSLAQVAVPRGRSGLVVDFNPEQRVGAEVILLDPLGRPISAGAVVRDAADGQEYPVGRGGQVYLRAPAGMRRLNVRAPGYACQARVPLQAGTEALRRVRCEATR